jgi:hypothetical protein
MAESPFAPLTCYISGSRVEHDLDQRYPTLMTTSGGGLHLQVTKTVSGELNKSWLYRYPVGGRERQMRLGSLTEVKLADARQKAAACR